MATQIDEPQSPANRAYFLYGGMGVRCRSRRLELGLSADQLCERDREGVLEPAFVRELEASELGEPPVALNLAEAAAIADALDLDVRCLLFGDEPKAPKRKAKRSKRAAKRAAKKRAKASR